MKKVYFTLLTFIVVVTLAACKTTTSDTTTNSTAGTTAGTTATTTASTTATTTIEVDIFKPIFKGLFGVDLIIGETTGDFDPMAGITAEDLVDGDLTEQIVVTLPADYDLAVPDSYTLTYTVTDAAGNTAVKLRTVNVKEKITGAKFLNPNFDDNELAPWNTSGSTATVVDGVAVVVVTSIGNDYWAAQFEQVNLMIEEGKTYRISFKAKADEARSIEGMVEDPANGYRKYGRQILNVTTEWATYSVDINVDTATITTAKFGVMMGKVDANSKPTTLYFDDFAITDISEAADETNPVITGAIDTVVEQNLIYDLKDAITVSDNKDKTLTANDLVIKNAAGEVVTTFDTSVIGDFTFTYTLTDESGNTVTVTRVITVKTLLSTNTNEILNGDFAQEETITIDHASETMWREWHDNSNAVSFDINEAGQIEINVTTLATTDNNDWQIQLQQAGIKLEKDKMYKLQFEAKSTVAREIKPLFKTASDATYNARSVNLTDVMTTYTFVFTVTGDTNENMVLAFNLGRLTGTLPSVVTLDNIKLFVLVEDLVDTTDPVIAGANDVLIPLNSTFDNKAGVSVSDNKDLLTNDNLVITGDTVNTAVAGTYTLTYTLADSAGNDTSVTRVVTVKEFEYFDTTSIKNGDFSEPFTTAWSEWHNGGREVAYTVNANGELEANITNIGDSSWEIQLQQKQFKLEKGFTYKFVFQAKSSVARDIEITFKTTADKGYNSKKFSLTTEMQSYEFNFTVTEPTVDNIQLSVNLGNFTGTPVSVVTLDNMKLFVHDVKVDTDKPLLSGVDNSIVSLNSTFDLKAGLSVWDRRDLTLTVDDVVVDGTVDTAVAGDYTLTYTLTDEAGNITTATRVVTVKEFVFIDTNDIVNGDFAADLSSGWVTFIDTNAWSGSVAAATASINAGIAEMDITALGGQSWAVQLQQEGIKLEKGKTYKLVFDASSTAPRDIYSKLGYDGTGNQWQGYGEILVNLTETSQTFELSFTVTRDTYTNIKLTFEMGGFNSAPVSKVSIDNVKLFVLE
ncbi:MAG: hypothetical protein K0Q49_484 [Haloplasmataceae bacterium]|jgi:hypothetical protein|nr:hypothetical protein [Haloplasmataceae bacterium]